jgi:repressor LexA
MAQEADFDERSGGIPMLGSVAAGFPVEPMGVEERLSIEGEFTSREPVFALQVSGESMIDDNIMPGDYVICRQTNEAKNGDVVVAIVDDNEATLKRFYKEKDHVRLQPANENYSPIITRNCTIKGVVVGLIRKM